MQGAIGTQLTKEEMQKIKELFASKKRSSLAMQANNPPAVDGRIREFEHNGAMARNWIKSMRGGMAAGNKDIYVVGD